jgi:hypothetical protein
LIRSRMLKPAFFQTRLAALVQLAREPEIPAGSKKPDREARQGGEGVAVPKSIPPSHFAGGPPETMSAKRVVPVACGKAIVSGGVWGGVEMKRTY